jgi:hypothetical protein
MIVKKLKVYVAVISLVMSLSVISIYGCSCELMTPKQRVKLMRQKADAIFIGSVKSISKEENVVRQQSAIKVILTVEKSWKNGEVEEYTIYTYGGCYVGFEKGKSYLVYAIREKTGQLETNMCMGTGTIFLSKKEVKLLGKPVFVNSINNSN